MKRFLLFVIALLIWALIVVWQRMTEAENGLEVATEINDFLMDQDIARHRARDNGSGWQTPYRIRGQGTFSADA